MRAANDKRDRIVPVVGWDDDGNALILDHKAGRRVRANQDPAFVSISRRPGWDTVVPAPPGWTVRWCQEGKDDIVDPVVGFMEDPGVDGGCPLLADLQMGLVFDLHQMVPHRLGYRPFLIPPSGSHES
ncbi:hypothetical protein [Streptomyces sp. NPDC056227]|uniref:hypothetical protein n=1 Tax=Streptomyces sp. NPDC056227 TaxID=3345753 RepID=UPI0035DBCF07